MNNKSTEMLICKNCKKEFQPNRSWQMFCSDKCRMEYWRKENPRIPASDMELIKRILNKKEK